MVTRSQCAAALVVLVGALSAAACGGTSANPGVANVGTGTQSTTTPASGPGLGNGQAKRFAQALAFSRCMRAHGVTNFPDPSRGPGGGIALQVQGNPNSPTFKSAQSACRSLLPNHGTGPALTPQQRQQALAFSRCVRAHGVPNFPDPDFSGGGVRVQGQDKNDPRLQAAVNACKSYLPKLGG